MKVFLVCLCLAIVVAEDQNNDSAGNIVASILSNSGNGNINQGNDNNQADNDYLNSVIAGPNGEEDVDTIAGNQEAQLLDDAGSDAVTQNEDGNNNADKVSNHVTGGSRTSVVKVDVGNEIGRTANATGNNNIGQIKDNNNAQNVFLNN